MKIIETDNHGSDYPNEKFVNLPNMSKENSDKICKIINKCLCPNDWTKRFWRVVEDNYELVGGFEP